MKVWAGIMVVVGVSVCLIGAFCGGAAVKAGSLSAEIRDERLFDTVNEKDASGVSSSEQKAGQLPLLTSLDREGAITCYFDKEEIDAEREIDALGFSESEDLISLVTEEPSAFPSKPLNGEEVCRLFYLIVLFCSPHLPIDGRLEKITIVREGENLTVYADVGACFERLSKNFRLDFLPAHVSFSLVLSFSVKNSQISANYEKIRLRCNALKIPDVLLDYGCGVVFGVKEYNRFFGDAVGNVFKNACFSG